MMAAVEGRAMRRSPEEPAATRCRGAWKHRRSRLTVRIAASGTLPVDRGASERHRPCRWWWPSGESRSRHLLLLGLALGVLCAFALPAQAQRMIVYGNSYTSPGSIKWPAQMLAAGDISSVYNLAVGGSTAGSYSSNNFAQQVTKRPAARAGDITVVFHGQNDCSWAGIAPDKFPGVARVGADVRAQLSRLVASGFTTGDRRLYVVLGFDWAKVPRYATGDATYARSRVHNCVLGINSQLRSAAAAYGARVIDAYDPLECVFRRPAAFGFTNVSRPGGAGYLFADRYHMTRAGQALLRQIIKYNIERGPGTPAQIFPGRGC